MSDINLTATFVAFRRMCFARLRAIEQETNDLKNCIVDLNQRLDGYENQLTQAGESKAIDMWLQSLQFDEDHRLIEDEKVDDIDEELF